MDYRSPQIFGQRGDLAIMTYNVKGLPWPIAADRGQALRQIGDRLAALRERGDGPQVVVLQEAFTDEAKAIAEHAGYRYSFLGSDADNSAPPPSGKGVARTWYLGETLGKHLDSGLMVLSDLPIRNVRRTPFPDDACAGFDCLAAKGILLVTVALPGGTDVTVATTHFNSRGASYAAPTATERAFAAQSDFLAAYLAREWSVRTPLVIAGDFNMGPRPFRMAVLPRALARLGQGQQPVEGLRTVMEADRHLKQQPDAQRIRQRARDMQFAFDGAKHGLQPVGASVPFGTEPSGASLSDHMGFTVRYRVVPAGEVPDRSRRAVRAKPEAEHRLASTGTAPGRR